MLRGNRSIVKLVEAIQRSVTRLSEVEYATYEQASLNVSVWRGNISTDTVINSHGTKNSPI